MRALAGICVSEPFLRTLWLGRLPNNVQAILATQQDTAMDKVAELADAITDTMPGRPSVAETTRSVSASSSTPTDLLTDRMMQMLITMQEQTEVMKAQIAELRFSRRDQPLQNHQRSRSIARRRSNSRRRDHSASGMCWYHAKFGRNAHRCIQPCTYSPAAGNATGSR
ncbi:hypothetical protein WH47_06163 [Habropoda laboriosa]|uniref:Uncharacterized protein n=1 Tax=Habropoda laboriosa TaxID=597456 RepID=A0A0L7QT70_9HYME|nr:hypothetical protein WH47_06163 [Habropoda laboriosa]